MSSADAAPAAPAPAAAPWSLHRPAFEPRTAVVTGSDSGIGRATAIALARAGLDVGVTWYADEQGGVETATAVRALGRRAVLSHLDVSDLDRCGDVVEALFGDLGGCDVFVNNAGMGRGGLLVDLTLDAWRETVATDLDGPFLVIQRAARQMIAAGRGGRIVAVTSVHAQYPGVGGAPYVAAKHGLSGLVKAAALELAAYGITCNAVAPGEIATRMNGLADVDPTTLERPGIPLRRPGSAAEVADVIAFLASPAASYVTGATWTVDGGMVQMGPLAGSQIGTDSWRGLG